MAPGPRVTKTTPGAPVSLPVASAIIAAPPSCRQTTLRMPLSCNPSSAARKLSPGTENTRVTPWMRNWSTRIFPPCRIAGPPPQTPAATIASASNGTVRAFSPAMFIRPSPTM